MKKLKIGVVGIGGFSHAFIPLFQAHPLVSEVAVADIVPERVQEARAKYGIVRGYLSLEDMLDSDVDAIAILTQRHLHGPMTIKALQAGKHVWCAVPMGNSAEEMQQIIQLVEQTHLVYMMAETSYYYSNVLYCRDRFQKGEFGHFVYGEGAYLHDMSQGFYDAFKNSGGPDWKKVAGFPPMHYSTHSASQVLSVTGARFTHVSCLGFEDRHEDGIFQVGGNYWDNPFSDQTALFRTSDGGMARINEFRRVGWLGKVSELPMSIFGTDGTFEECSGGQFWTDLTNNKQVTDLAVLLTYPRDVGYNPADYEVTERNVHRRYSKVQPFYRLPRAFWSQQNGHIGSHQFLVDDFVKSVYTGQLPPVHAWEAAKYTVPGLIAHESAKQGGKQLPIPDFGTAPAGWDILDPEKKIHGAE
jgi:predicted dehydrogenase